MFLRERKDYRGAGISVLRHMWEILGQEETMSELQDLERRIERLEQIVDRVIGVIAEEVVLREPESEVQVSGVPYKVDIPVSLPKLGEGKRRS